VLEISLAIVADPPAVCTELLREWRLAGMFYAFVSRRFPFEKDNSDHNDYGKGEDEGLLGYCL
jgi:hypothetical protein